MTRIVAGTAIPEPDVEIAIGTERQVPAVVVRERLRDECRAAGAVHRRSKREVASAISRIADRRNRATTVSPARIGEVHEEPAAGRVGRKRQAQQPVLAARRDRAREIEKRRRQHASRCE